MSADTNCVAGPSRSVIVSSEGPAINRATAFEDRVVHGDDQIGKSRHEPLCGRGYRLPSDSRRGLIDLERSAFGEKRCNARRILAAPGCCVAPRKVSELVGIHEV